MILYSNSCSYGVCSTGRTYSDYLGDHYGAQVVNAGLPGSCNSRILRTSVRDLLDLSKKDKVKAFISLGALYRSEIWNKNKPAIGNDGHFESFQISNIDKDRYNNRNKFAKEWYRWYNGEAEITNICTQLIMFTSFLEKQNIDYLIWAGAMNYKPVDFVHAPFLNTLYAEVKSNSRILNLFEFSFSKYCSIIKGYVPYDADEFDIYGHHTEEAHKDFAEYLIINHEI